MKRILTIFLIFMIPWISRGQTFAEFIDHLNSLALVDRQAVVDSFMNAGHAFPYTETDTTVHFIHTGNAQSVAYAGDATGWNPNKNLQNITGTTFWYLSQQYEPDARLDYKYVLNGTDWVLDALNPNTCSGGFGPNSEMRMPAYVVPPEISYYSNIPHGSIKDTTFQSLILGNSRPIKVYLPAGYSPSGPGYPVALFHDGLEYISLGKTVNILDYLIQEHMITPVIAVFVPPVDRNAEYAGNKINLFTDFIVQELMPYIDQQYNTSQDPSKRATIGASNGGNVSLYIGMTHHENFGRVAAQSSNVQSLISNTFQNMPKLNLELYIDIGKYDIAELIPLVENFVQILTSKSYVFSHYQWNEGHSWGNWKGHLRYPLMQFFPYPSAINEIKPSPDLRIDQIRPNPFKDCTQVVFSAPAGSKVQLLLYDQGGRELETLFSGTMEKATAEVKLTGHNLSPGNYYLTLRMGNYKKTSIITLVK
jgi:enterochelin esterase family protein